ncbi:hypothetical protein Pelo_16999 [Pelomyxa schiedti]|nr:hypothetical protein Pelo_16999 [Pelomyxa schiedti]
MWERENLLYLTEALHVGSFSKQTATLPKLHICRHRSVKSQVIQVISKSKGTQIEARIKTNLKQVDIWSFSNHRGRLLGDNGQATDPHFESVPLEGLMNVKMLLQTITALKVSYLVGLLFPKMLLQFSAAGNLCFPSNTANTTQRFLHISTSFLPIIAVDDALHVRFVFSAPVVQYHYSRCLAAHCRSLQPEDVSAAYYTELCFSAGLYYDVPNNSGSKLGKNSLNVNIYCFSFHVLYLPAGLHCHHSDCIFDFFQKVDAAWQLCKSALKTSQNAEQFLAFHTNSRLVFLITMTYSCRIPSHVVQDDVNTGTQILVCCEYCCASCSIDSGARDVPNAKAPLVHEIIHDLFLYSNMNTQPNWNPQVILKACGSISAQFLHPISCQYTWPPYLLPDLHLESALSSVSISGFRNFLPPSCWFIFIPRHATLGLVILLGADHYLFDPCCLKSCHAQASNYSLLIVPNS